MDLKAKTDGDVKIKALICTFCIFFHTVVSRVTFFNENSFIFKVIFSCCIYGVMLVCVCYSPLYLSDTLC